MWDGLPLHLRKVTFDLQDTGVTPSVIDRLGDVLYEVPDVFSESKTEFGSCYLLPFDICVPPDSPQLRPTLIASIRLWQSMSTPYGINTVRPEQFNTLLCPTPALWLLSP